MPECINEPELIKVKTFF